MPIAIHKPKKNDNYHDKGELDWHEGGGVGWNPDYVKKFKGTGQKDQKRYGKNFSRMKGICRKCGHFDKTIDKADGSHCKLGQGVGCVE